MSQSNLSEEPETKIYAGFWRRLGAALVDAAILGTAGALVSTLQFMLMHQIDLPVGFRHTIVPYTVIQFVPAAFETMLVFSPILSFALCSGWMEPRIFLYVLTFPVLNWLYHAILESSPKRGTLGKLAFNIALTDRDGVRLSFGRATARHFAKIVSTLLFGIGFLMAGFTRQRQALHDKIAGCLVVVVPARVAMLSQIARWAATSYVLAGVLYGLWTFWSLAQFAQGEAEISRSFRRLSDRAVYLAEVRRRIKRHWSLPPAGKSGPVLATFKIDTAGRVSDLVIAQSSGQPQADKSVITAITKAAPFARWSDNVDLLTVSLTFNAGEVIETGRPTPVPQPEVRP